MAEIWTPLKLLAWTQDYFAKKSVDSPRLTAELLLAHALGCDRVRLYLDFEKPIQEPELATFRALVKRRADGEPTAYLLGKREFFGHGFAVSPAVLVPRPETEALVEAALAALPREGPGSVLDLCTGSGAIAVSVALGRPGTRVVATDLSEEALAVARANAEKLGAVVEFAHGDLWAAVHAGDRFDVILSNPPYIPSAELAGLSREVRREPCIALDGGPDGLDVLRRVVAGAPSRLAPGGVLAVELHEGHAERVVALCREAGFEQAEGRKDLAGLPRYVVARMAAGR
ncbi:MAG: peptide chain release factor N(5)-glutamine methyltransferase [Anaeromyxobacteraceae bacterium]